MQDLAQQQAGRPGPDDAHLGFHDASLPSQHGAELLACGPTSSFRSLAPRKPCPRSGA
jgi:hypothetical protein